jgi:hypothetical protein
MKSPASLPHDARLQRVDRDHRMEYFALQPATAAADDT